MSDILDEKDQGKFACLAPGEIRRLREENSRLRSTLEWYGNKDNYPDGEEGMSEIEDDKGERARVVLELNLVLSLLGKEKPCP